MHTTRRVALALGALAAPLIAFGLSSGTASAHGWVTLPTSRQEQCAEGIVSCGDIKYEPQSVEGPKGLHSCSGGNAQFAELDDDSKGWQVTPVGSSATFTWHNTARHATLNWQYYIGSTLLAEFPGNNQQPPADLSHQVNFGSFTGKQKVLAVWNIGDTANAFYSCIDVSIGGTGSTTGGTTTGGTTTGGTTTGGTTTGGTTTGGTTGGTGSCTAAPWAAATVYNGGETVSHNGHNWKAKWWTQGEEPGTTGQWGVWDDLGAC
ncbi:lytic polysaccharide monooxygenase [Streptomyces sp. NPDC021020]|uniref:lytic polysaccharide monooxygenase n=1 Tax=Streptomyces sp. NPDC021020 TaxID=3365109 RepID=UPI00378ED0F6